MEPQTDPASPDDAVAQATGLVASYQSGGLSRRQFGKGLMALGFGWAAASAILTACGGDDSDEPAAGGDDTTDGDGTTGGDGLGGTGCSESLPPPPHVVRTSTSGNEKPRTHLLPAFIFIFILPVSALF